MLRKTRREKHYVTTLGKLASPEVAAVLCRDLARKDFSFMIQRSGRTSLTDEIRMGFDRGTIHAHMPHCWLIMVDYGQARCSGRLSRCTKGAEHPISFITEPFACPKKAHWCGGYSQAPTRSVTSAELTYYIGGNSRSATYHPLAS